MSNPSETVIDPPPSTTNYGCGLSIPTVDYTYLDEFDFDQSFSFDEILDLEQLLNSDTAPAFDQEFNPFDPNSDQFGFNQILDCQNPISSELYGVGKCESSGNCGSNVSEESKNGAPESYSPDSNNGSVKVGVFDKDVTLDGSVKREKVRKRKKIDDSHETDNKDCSFENCGMGEEEKRKARLVRNRERVHLSRQRKKQYIEELEDKVKSMHAMIQDLNMKVSYFMAENVTLRQQVSGVVPPVPMVYPQAGVMYPWMPYSPLYMVKTPGSQVPLVAIPRSVQKMSKKVENKKVESKKNEGKRTKKVASVSFLGLLFFIMLFGGLVPVVNVRYGGIKEAFVGRESYVGGGSYKNHHGKVLMVNGTVGGDRGQSIGEGNEFLKCNRSEPLTASLYVPRNDKLVKIDGNLIIHSILASEKAMASNGKEVGETGLAVREDLSPAIPVAGVTRNGVRHLPARTTDGKIKEWFREGIAGPMLTSGMCTEVFQFDVSSAIVPASSPTNISKDQNTTQLGQQRNRRILYDHPIPLPKSSRSISEREVERK